MMQFYNILGKPAQFYETTNPDWVPTLHMGHKVTVPDQERHKRELRNDLKEKEWFQKFALLNQKWQL